MFKICLECGNKLFVTRKEINENLVCEKCGNKKFISDEEACINGGDLKCSCGCNDFNFKSDARNTDKVQVLSCKECGKEFIMCVNSFKRK